jgi:hypothetical protein
MTVLRTQAEERAERALAAGEDRFGPAQGPLRPGDERAKNIHLTDRGQLAEQAGGQLERLLMPPRGLVGMGQRLERAERVGLPGALGLEEVEQIMGLVQGARVDPAQGRAGAGLGQVGIERQGLLIEHTRLPIFEDLVEMGGEPGAEPGVVGEHLHGRGAELGGLVVLVKGEEARVDLQCGTRRGVAAESVHAAGRLELPRLLELGSIGGEVPRAGRA